MKRKMRKHFLAFVSILLLAAFCLSGCNISIYLTPPLLEGKPWLTSTVSGNLCDKAPDIKDDLFTHVNFDFIKENQGANYYSMGQEYDYYLEESVISLIEDESIKDPRVDMLRTFFGQAMEVCESENNVEAELMNYIDKLDNVNSIEELNALLLSEDFPFMPFLLTDIVVPDAKSGAYLALDLNNLFTDNGLEGEDLYSNDSASLCIADLMATGYGEEEAMEITSDLMNFEYKYFDEYLKSVEGEEEDASFDLRKLLHSAEEVFGTCKSFPLQSLLAKQGLDKQAGYIVWNCDWLKTIDSLWTEDNLDIIKLYTVETVFNEIRDCLSPTFYDDIYGEYAGDSESFAYDLCFSENTLGNLMAELFIDYCIDEEGIAALESLTPDIIDAYKELVSNSSWMSEKSKDAALLKLDKMNVCFLKPGGGLENFENVRLKSDSEGGSLLSNYLLLRQNFEDYKKQVLDENRISDDTWTEYAACECNCTYDIYSNTINIFPGYMAEIFYYDNLSYEEILADMGHTIAHEIAHAFDNDGSQRDANGCLNPIFEDDMDEYTKRCDELINYINGFEIIDGFNLDGELVLIEVMADNIAYQVILKLIEDEEDFDYDKFYTRLAEIFAEVLSKDYLEYIYASETHPIPNVRVNMMVQMFDDFYDVYGVSEGDAMYLPPEKRICFL